MKWHRPEFNKNAMNIKKGDVVKLRDDIFDHKEEINCYYVDKHKKYEGKKVVIREVARMYSNKTVAFKIEGERVFFDTDMIDWDYDNDVNHKSELIGWIKNNK